jgi:hypothetical protein
MAGKGRGEKFFALIELRMICVSIDSMKGIAFIAA